MHLKRLLTSFTFTFPESFKIIPIPDFQGQTSSSLQLRVRVIQFSQASHCRLRMPGIEEDLGKQNIFLSSLLTILLILSTQHMLPHLSQFFRWTVVNLHSNSNNETHEKNANLVLILRNGSSSNPTPCQLTLLLSKGMRTFNIFSWSLYFLNDSWMGGLRDRVHEKGSLLFLVKCKIHNLKI